MHGLFISSIKQKSNTCILLRIFLRVTILRPTFSSSPTICSYLDAGYWDSRKSASLSVYLSTRKQVSNGDVMWTCFKCFSCYLRLGSFAVEGANDESACTRSTYAGNAFSAISACIKAAGLEDTDMEDAYTESVCTKGVG